MPQVLPMTRVEAYLAYKAGVIQESSLKPTLKTNFYTGLEHWLAFWCGLCEDYPVDENNDPKWYNEEEYYIAYLCGIAQDYPTNCYRRVGAYLRHIISYRWPAPEKPLTREEYYLSLINSTTTSNPIPSSNFTLNDTTDGVFQGVEVYGDTFQQTYTGKNLLGLEDQTFEIAGVDVTISNGEITMDGRATASGRHALSQVDSTTLDGEYTTSVVYLSGSLELVSNTGGNINMRHYSDDTLVANSQAYFKSAESVSKTVTISPSEHITFAVYVLNGEVYNNYKIKPQVTKTAQADYNYEPYTGGIPAPNPDYPQDVNVVTGEQTVKVIGKNLFDKNNLNSMTGTIEPNGTLGSGGNNKTFFLKCEPNTTYTIQKRNDGDANRFIVAWSELTPVGGIRVYGRIQDYDAHSITITTGATAEYLLVTYYRNTETVLTEQQVIDSIQVELSPTATDYQPYQSQSYSLSLGSLELCKIGDYQDVIFKNTPNSPLYDNTLVEGGWYKHAEVGKVALNSTNTSMFQLTQADTYSDLRITKSSFGMVASWNNSGAFCTHFTLGGGSNKAPGRFYIGVALSNIAFYLPASIGTLQAAKNYMDALTDSYIYFAMATPTNTQITDAALVEQLEALAAGQSYDPLTNFIVTATDPNLPALLKVTAYKKQ